jgi:hypothetical protein
VAIGCFPNELIQTRVIKEYLEKRERQPKPLKHSVKFLNKES